MNRSVSDWVNGLLDDFWDVYYPNIPRRTHATESKCKAIENEIDHHISYSSLSNYFRGRGSMPTDSTKNILAFYVLMHWQKKYPQLGIEVDEETAEAALSRNDKPNNFLLAYYQLKGQVLLGRKELPEGGEPLQLGFALFPKGDFRFFKRSFWLNLAFVLLILGAFIWRQLTSDTPIPSFNQTDLSYRQNLTIIALFHVGMIALLMVLFYTISDGRKAHLSARGKDVRQGILFFQRGWLGIYFSWLLLYLWLSFKWYYEGQLVLRQDAQLGFFSAASWAVADVLSLASTFLFFYLFNLLDTRKGKGDMSRVFNKIAASLGKLLYLFTVVVCFSILDRFYELGAFENIGVLIYSLLTALSMLYLFGRLDSHHFNTNRLILAPLYIYALLQMVWGSVNSDPNHYLSIALFFMAFLLKIYFFFLMTKWLRNGNLERYFGQVY